MLRPQQQTRSILCLTLLFLSALVRAPSQDLRSLHHQAWSTEEGLPQSSVHSILQTQDGFLWIATEAGLARFDAFTFSTFSHQTDPAFASDDICCLAETPSGDLWIGTADGLLRLRQGIFHRFGEQDGLPSASIHALVATADGLLVLTEAGLVRLSQDRFAPVPGTPANPTALLPGLNGTAWLLTQASIAVVRDGQAHPWQAPKSFPDPATLTGIAEGPQGTLWVWTPTTLTASGNGATRIWRTGRQIPGARIQTLRIDPGGQAWIGTNEGLATVTLGDAAAAPIPSLHGSAVLTTIADREGNIWAGTETTGLHILRTLKFRSETALAAKPLTAAIEVSDGTIWAGTRQDGLLRLRNGAVDEPAPAAKLTSPVILSLAPGPGGSVWAGTPDGLNLVQPQGTVRRTTAADGLPDDYIQTLAAAPDGSVWIGTRRGLAHLQGGRIVTLTRAEGLPGDLIGTLFLTPRGDLWIASSGGLSRRSPNGRLTTYTPHDGLPPGVVTAMTQDARSGDLWLALRNGTIAHFDGHAFHALSFGPQPTPIIAIAADTAGFLWLRQERGLARTSIAELAACRADVTCAAPMTHFGPGDGLPSEEAIGNASPLLSITATGELLLPTRRGLAVADAAHLPTNPVPPPVAIERLLIDDTPLEITSAEPQIPFGHNRLTLDYAGLSFTVPSAVQYRFLLEGFDRAWTNAATRRSATYTNLPPGSYRFRVQASNNDGVWNATGAELRFRIVPPFYRRWWFYLLATLLLAASAGGLYQLRLHRLQVEFDAVLRERNRMAREIHDTLAQDFVGVSIQLDIITQLLSIPKVEAALNQVRQTRQLVTDGLADARQSIWELRANVAKDSLPTRLASLVERFSHPLPIRLRITGAYRPLEPRTESEILRIAQEALSNIQRHAQASAASIEVRYDRTMLVVTIMDDGIGFVLNSRINTPGHYGLSGMMERAVAAGAKLEIISAPGGGTKITLSTLTSGPSHQQE